MHGGAELLVGQLQLLLQVGQVALQVRVGRLQLTEKETSGGQLCNHSRMKKSSNSLQKPLTANYATKSNNDMSIKTSVK